MAGREESKVVREGGSEARRVEPPLPPPPLWLELLNESGPPEAVLSCVVVAAS